jgi:hypothetical protein
VKILYKGEVVKECGIDAALAGIRCDAIQLDAHDVTRLYRAMNSGSEVGRSNVAQFLERWLCRFVPPER